MTPLLKQQPISDDVRFAVSHVFRLAIASQWRHSPCSRSFKMKLTYLGQTRSFESSPNFVAVIKRQTKLARVNAPLVLQLLSLTTLNITSCFAVIVVLAICILLSFALPQRKHYLVETFNLKGISHLVVSLYNANVMNGQLICLLVPRVNLTFALLIPRPSASITHL